MALSVDQLALTTEEKSLKKNARKAKKKKKNVVTYFRNRPTHKECFPSTPPPQKKMGVR